ncbi:hypothetical protein MDAP_000415 [Mitosporidium daphniae]|uniref:Uncharacterized protein n=1 Tax=Mitosporidium daphniae TaxID=1485682 RepID=A0A098VUK6_9MICR|nr:uncharacterized protein DI09_149p50 [Mitosporidium daphniae]KGG52657.1 hypothetical protein DI09_149p50 [Mitosporidium daphniae]|eukprot:XP_013239093.1 uncharacterized protein DI09_149p50 [Mitosporidium daphniae]
MATPDPLIQNISLSDILSDALYIFQEHIEAFFFLALTLFFVFPFFSKRGIFVASIYITSYLSFDETEINGSLLKRILDFFRQTFPGVSNFSIGLIKRYAKDWYWLSRILEFGNNVAESQNPQPKGIFELGRFFKRRLPKIVNITLPTLDPSVLYSPSIVFNILNIYYVFDSIQSKFQSEEIRCSISAKCVIFILFYIWQYDSLLPGNVFIYSFKYSPLPYIMIALIQAIDFIFSKWIPCLLLSCGLILLLNKAINLALFLSQYVLFSLGFIFYLDYFFIKSIFGTSMFCFKAATIFVDLFMGREYVPYLQAIWKELKTGFLTRSKYWLQVAYSDAKFRVYFLASTIFIATGIIKVIFDLSIFGISTWFPYLYFVYSSWGDVHVTYDDDWRNIHFKTSRDPNDFITNISKYISIVSFTFLGLLFLVWDSPSTNDRYSCIILSVPIFMILFSIGYFSCNKGGPFHTDPFQLVGLIYTIYSEDVCEAEASATSIEAGGYQSTNPIPLASPLEALKGKQNRLLSQNIPQLAVALLCDTGMFTSFFDAWSILRPIIRAFSKQRLAFGIDNLAIFQILENLKGNKDAYSYVSQSSLKDFGDFSNELSQEEREHSLLRGEHYSWSPRAMLETLLYRPKNYSFNSFRDGHHGRHFCRLIMEAFIYGILLSSKLVILPKGSVLTSFKRLWWIIWSLFVTTMTPRSISAESILNQVLRSSPKNILKSLFIGENYHFTPNGIISLFRNAISRIPLKPSVASGNVKFLHWFIYSQSFGKFNIIQFAQNWIFGLPIQSQIISVQIQRQLTLVSGLFFRTYPHIKMILLIFIGGPFLMAYQRPWNWMDFYSILTINCIYWGWRPSVKMIYDAPYPSLAIRRCDESLTMFMICFLFSLGWMLPNFLARMFRPLRFLLQLFSFYLLGNIPRYLLNIFGGHFGETGSLLGTGMVLFSISGAQVYIYKKLYKLFSTNIWNGIRVSYGQGEEAKKLLMNELSVDGQAIDVSEDGLVSLETCPGIRSYWLDEIVEFLGGKNVPMEIIYPSIHNNPGYLDLIDSYFFPDDEFSKRIQDKPAL